MNVYSLCCCLIYVEFVTCQSSFSDLLSVINAKLVFKLSRAYSDSCALNAYIVG